MSEVVYLGGGGGEPLPLDPLDDGDDDERGRQMFELLMTGRSLRSVAKEFGITSKQVEAAALRYLPTIDEAALRKRYRHQIGLLESLQLKFHHKALRDECTASALIALKASERLSAMLGYDAPRPTQPIAMVAEPVSSTERIRRALDMLVATRPPPEPDGPGEPEDPAKGELAGD